MQDYQLQLVPAMLRELRPDLRIGFFLHIPFPPIELFMQLPRRAEILRGLLGADLVGFQQPLAAQNFLRLARHLLGPALRRATSIEVDGREVQAGAFPISIDVGEMERLAADPVVQARAEQIRAELGDPKTIILGVDRLDYTKGIEHRLKAFRELLADGRLNVPETVMVQVATPSRERVEHYQALRDKVEREVGRINGEFGRVGVPAVHYLHQSYSRSELAALYCAADVMVVTPLRDGMNLVAKEYVAARADLGGALVLSRVRRRGRRAAPGVPVQPARPRRVKDALLRAVTRRPSTRPARRMRAMRRHLRTHDVAHWASDVPRPSSAAAPTDDRGMTPSIDVDRDGRSTRTCAPRSARIARVPQLLVACDYDGTLAPIVDDPTRPSPLPEAVAAIRVAGRAAADHRRGHLRPGAARPGRAVPAAQRGPPRRQPRLRVRRRLRRAARARAGRAAHPAARPSCARSSPGRTRAYGWSSKPASVAVHTARRRPRRRRRGHRGGPRRPGHLAGRARDRRQGGHRAVGGRHDKGTALDAAAHASSRPARCSSSATTSPTRTRSRNLHGPDVGIKIGAGRHRGRATASPTRSRRRACSACCWRPGGTGSTASGRCRSSGTRCWPTAARSRCSPRTPRSPGCATRSPDSSAVFADLLGGGPAGHFTRRARRARRHPARPALPAGHDDRGDPLVRADRHRLLDSGDQPDARPATRRWSGCSTGAGRVRLEFAPRPEFGQVPIAACSRSATGCWCSAPTSRSRCYAPGVEWERRRRRRPRHRPRRGRPGRRRRHGRPGAALRHARACEHRPRADRPSGRPRAERPWRDWVGVAEAARRRPGTWCCAAR